MGRFVGSEQRYLENWAEIFVSSICSSHLPWNTMGIPHWRRKNGEWIQMNNFIFHKSTKVDHLREANTNNSQVLRNVHAFQTTHGIKICLFQPELWYLDYCTKKLKSELKPAYISSNRLQGNDWLSLAVVIRESSFMIVTAFMKDALHHVLVLSNQLLRRACQSYASWQPQVGAKCSIKFINLYSRYIHAWLVIIAVSLLSTCSLVIPIYMSSSC